MFPTHFPPPSLMPFPPPLVPAQPVIQLPNHIEILCTMPDCLEYCKEVCNCLRCLNLRVGVLNPPPNSPIDQIVESIKISGVTAIVFVDLANQRDKTISVKFVNNSDIKLKDIPLDMAVQELSKAFGLAGAGPGVNEVLQQEEKMLKDGSRDEHEKERQAKDICNRVLRDTHPLTLHETDQLIKYIAEKRDNLLKEEYKDYIPHNVRNVAAGPYGDVSLKIERSSIEETVMQIIQRNVDVPNEPEPAEISSLLKDEEKLKTAITSLMSLTPDGLKQLTSLGSAGSNTSNGTKSSGGEKSKQTAASFWN